MMARMDVDFELLADFLAVTKEGTTIAAARARHISQPALSARIARLEKAVGATLFERSAGGMRLTEAGQRFEPFVRQALTALERGAQVARDGGTLRVGVVDDELAVVRQVVQKLPAPVQVLRLGEPEQERLLRSGDLDLAIAGPQVFPGLPREVLSREKLSLAVPAAHPLAGQDQVTVAQTADEVHYLPREEFAPSWVALVRDLFADAGINPGTYAVQSDSSLNPLRWVAAGECVAISLASTPAPAGVAVVPLVTPRRFEWVAIARSGSELMAVSSKIRV